MEMLTTGLLIISGKLEMLLGPEHANVFGSNTVITKRKRTENTKSKCRRHRGHSNNSDCAESCEGSACFHDGGLNPSANMQQHSKFVEFGGWISVPRLSSVCFTEQVTFDL